MANGDIIQHFVKKPKGTKEIDENVNVDGDVAVSGTITGNVTGNVTGNADTATNATNDANGDRIDNTYYKKTGGALSGAITRDLGGGQAVIPKTRLFQVDGSTDGFYVDYESTTADKGKTTIYTTDDDNAEISVGNQVSGTYKEAINIKNGKATIPTISGNVNVEGKVTQTNFQTQCDSGNTANYPVHRIATVTAGTGSWQDKDTILEIKGNFDTQYYGLVKISLRTNDASQGSACSGAVRWLVRSGWTTNSVTLARWGVSGQNVYADVFLSVGAYARVTIAQYDPVRSWTLIKSNEVNNTTASDKKDSVECYKDVATAGTQLRGKAYTATHTGSDVATVNYANSASSATTWIGNTALTNDHATLNTGDTWIPVIASGKIQHTLRAIWNSKQHSNHNTNQHYLATLSTLSFWNGAYNSSNNSNLTYAHQGTIQCKPTYLYNNASGTNGNITLNETSANFAFIDVFYIDSHNRVLTARTYSPSTGGILLYTNSPFAKSQTCMADVGARKFNGKAFNLADDEYGTWNSWNNSWNRNNNIKVIKVLGYR